MLKRYTVINYATKRQLLDDFMAGKRIRVYPPIDMNNHTGNGGVMIEGPTEPGLELPRWYAYARIQNFVIKSIM